MVHVVNYQVVSVVNRVLAHVSLVCRLFLVIIFHFSSLQFEENCETALAVAAEAAAASYLLLLRDPVIVVPRLCRFGTSSCA